MNASQPSSFLESVTAGSLENAPRREILKGRYVRLDPLDATRDARALFDQSHGSEDRRRIWEYLPDGPFADLAAMEHWLHLQERVAEYMFFTVIDTDSDTPVGMVSFLNIVPVMRRLEVGYIWYGLSAQRTRINTESIFLMLRHAFDDLSYRRVEWKCNALNQRSRDAAIRLGFVFEGVFARHMIVKGRNRDTAWYAMTDRRWPAVKANMTRWLYESDAESVSLRTLNTGIEPDP